MYGTLNSQPQTTYLIDLYRNDSCDPSGYGQGQTHIFAGNVTTSSFGQALFSIDMASHPASPGDFITATATDPQGNTSEFSACVLLDYETGGTATYTPISTATAAESPTPLSPVESGPNTCYT